jgi:hypothetical protein
MSRVAGAGRKQAAARRGALPVFLCTAAALAVLLPPPAAAQTQDTVYLLGLPPTARLAGLNGAGVAVPGDAGAVFVDPSGLATLRHIGLEGLYRAAPGDAWHLSGALGWRIRQFDLGVGVQRFDFGSNPNQYLGGAIPGGTNARESQGAASLVYRFGLIALGVSGKYVRRRLDDVKTDGWSGDAGITIAFFDIMAIAFAVQNIGGNWRDTSSLVMPRHTRLGFTMNYVDPQESFRLMSSVEVQWREGRSARGVIAGEAGIVLSGVGIVGRAGFSGRPDVLSDSEWTLGGTLNVGALKLDYAYRHEDVLGEPAHYLGLRFTL